MAKKRMRQRKCPFCKEMFKPDPYNAHRQYACTKASCQQARKKQSQRKYLNEKKKDDQWRVKESERVKEWQKANPEYWRNKKSLKMLQSDALLRDFALGENGTEENLLRDSAFFYRVCFFSSPVYS